MEDVGKAVLVTSSNISKLKNNSKICYYRVLYGNALGPEELQKVNKKKLTITSGRYSREVTFKKSNPKSILRIWGYWQNSRELGFMREGTVFTSADSFVAPIIDKEYEDLLV